MDTIRVYLPEPPPPEQIENYGLPPAEQRWHPPVIPPRLKTLEKRFPSLSEIKRFLIDHQVEYREEIEFIEREWQRRQNGHWLYINRVPTYIDGWHYTYMGYWYLDVGLPSYRDRDRWFFIFARYCYTTKELPDGTDLGRRICYGFNYPKMRREGATYKAECINYCIITSFFGAWGGIQSMDGPSARKAFLLHLVMPWKKLPFFFKPAYDGSTSPKSELLFDVPGRKQGSLALVETGLEGGITFGDSSLAGWYDGWKLMFYHDDETGKIQTEDSDFRWNVVKKCLSQQVNIHGLSIATSTVGEMAKKGGNNFAKTCKKSHWSQRIQNGQTKSGKFNLFIPSYYGMEGFIDIFGNSIISDPSEEDLWRIPNPFRDKNGKLMGSKRYLDSYLDDVALDESDEAMANYEEELRMNPREFSECFITAGSGTGFNLKKIINRMKELQFVKDATVVGNFKRRNNEKDGAVYFDPNPNGRFKLSLQLRPEEANLKIMTTIFTENRYKQVYAPMKPDRFTACGDPFKFRVTQGKRMSQGAGNVFWHRDKDIDPDTKPIKEWQSYRNVCTYLYRPPRPEDYAEDMLMMCEYYGAMMYPEINVPLIWDHFCQRDRDGYLKYAVDLLGNRRKTPGFFNKGEDVRQRLFQVHQRYIEDHCEREMHYEILYDVKHIKSLDELTDYDLFVAVGGSYIGAEQTGNPLLVHNEEYDVGNYF